VRELEISGGGDMSACVTHAIHKKYGGKSFYEVNALIKKENKCVTEKGGVTVSQASLNSPFHRLILFVYRLLSLG
jgi:hypothetical protein